MPDTKKVFNFVDVNPEMSGLAFAAEAEGGICIGVFGVKPKARESYESYFGRGSLEPPLTPCDMVLVGLPFSMFVRPENGDPAVTELIKTAFTAAKGASAILFRTPWSSAARLGVDQEEYRSTVEGILGTKKWAVAASASRDGHDLFICGVARKKWNEWSHPLPAFPYAQKATKSTPREILLEYGYPESFALQNADVDPKLVEGIVDVRNARLAISEILKAIR